ncbi:MAG TPA: apolipoprotein N-acyltransferase [Thermoguttaceae bacterium]|nr:apolipoprotein N-acyltransferase [Thermoguttaceae bacterium]HPP53296.1 apolipoprotein N-acyltransferase [Thermoguttaceae bacterium]
MSRWRAIGQRSTFWPALLGAVVLLAAFPLPTGWFGWLGPVAPNVDTSPPPEAILGSGPAPGGLAQEVSEPIIPPEQASRLSSPVPGPWYVSLAHLAWVAPTPWLVLVRRRQLPGRRPYLALWTVGFLYWLVQLHWLTLPYWATSLGWVALSWYLAFYLPVFVGLTRTAVHRFRMPLILAAPVVWTGLELARGHLITGFTMASLGHTQYRWLALIQVCDLVGAYGLGFVMMFVSACLARMLPLSEADPSARSAQTASEAESDKLWAGRWALWPILPALAMLAGVLCYGYWRLGQEEKAQPELMKLQKGASVETSSGSGRQARIALIQGSIDTKIKDDPQKQTLIMEQYIRLSQEAVRRFGRVDLLVWPETMFRTPWVTVEEPIAVPEDWPGSPEEFRRYAQDSVEWGRRQAAELAHSLGVPLLLGIDGVHFGPEGMQFFNTALFVDAQGNLLDRYDKMHPVLFGEYVPLAKRIRFLQKLTPLGQGLTEGQRAVAVPVGSDRILVAPTICYESVLPHVVRRAILMLRAEGNEPEVMANLTNDGWFYGSIELDLHLICGVFRAVEFRKPWVIAANTGFSAWIDGSGRIRRLGPRRATGVVLAEVQPDSRRSLYLDWGDWFAGLCLAGVVLVAVGGILHNGLLRPRPSAGAGPASGKPKK